MEPDYFEVLHNLIESHNITTDTYAFFGSLIADRDRQNRYGEPMIWIGFYIAAASLFCMLLMLFDLLDGIGNKKLWFPCKYFTLNAASLSLIAVAMKLPVDLNNPMEGVTDQSVKYGSLAFMCTMMANLLPSLGSMNGKELVTNIIALGIFIITMVVNVCIQLQTGVLYHYSLFLKIMATIDVVMLLFMLMIYTSLALTIVKSKQILESKYQACHEKALTELAVQQPGGLMVENLKKHVNNHWIMAATGSPQLMVACSATNSAAGVICAITTVVHVIQLIIEHKYIWEFDSDYKWSTPIILRTQLMGVIIGTIAPISRCFASLNLKFSRKWIFRHIKVFKVESYSTQKLYDWKRSNIPFPLKSRRCKIVIDNLKVLILSLCIGLQVTTVVSCKMVSLILIPFIICVLFCSKWLKAIFSALGFVAKKEPELLQQNEDLRQYVLQLQDDVELADRTLKAMLTSVNHLIQKAEKEKPVYLLKLLDESSGFEGVGMHDLHQIPSLLAKEFSDCWSLTVVTLTTIAISLPNIQKDRIDKLLYSVSEGLAYVTLIEESLNSSDDYVNLQKASKMLWLEVEVHYKWLGNNLQNVATQVNSVKQILQWFTDTAKNLITKVENTNIDVPNDNSIGMSVCANSMYRITQAILLSYNANIDEVSQEQLFTRLSSMISDILAACLTNLPQVIALKCHTNVIEKREASVHAAAQLLGQTMEIINSLQDRGLPNLDPADLPFIEKWHNYFIRPIP
uniref:uncharacterized protein LOC122588544 n=1 Tax=Erigeron canadensis TaxID=72917 RepID=UPI001CB9419B|nr:uncharacterized protein LOC122588544 [Erigeron canadensis]